MRIVFLILSFSLASSTSLGSKLGEAKLSETAPPVVATQSAPRYVYFHDPFDNRVLWVYDNQKKRMELKEDAEYVTLVMGHSIETIAAQCMTQINALGAEIEKLKNPPKKKVELKLKPGK